MPLRERVQRRALNDVATRRLCAPIGDFAQVSDLSAARTKDAKTRLIRNSVCPQVSAALVLANLGPQAETMPVLGA